jgi:hypothetical protein
MLAFAISCKRFEVIGGRYPKIVQIRRTMKHRKFPHSRRFDVRESLHARS